MHGGLLVGALLVTLATPASGQSADEQAIRAARGASNRAIAAHDVDAMAVHWMENFHITTSISALRAGREANRVDFGEHFTNRPDVVYVRTPATVEVFVPWGVAAEAGKWTGQWSEAGVVTRLGGSYYAQWRKLAGVWLIQSEVFVPSWCEGSDYCERHPPP